MTEGDHPYLLVAEAVQDAASHLQEDVRRHIVQILEEYQPSCGQP